MKQDLEVRKVNRHCPLTQRLRIVSRLCKGRQLYDYPFDDRRKFRRAVCGGLMGAILPADGIAEAASPGLTGRLRDTTGSYSEGYFMLVRIALLGAATVLALPATRKAS